MILKAYSILDAKVGVYSPPFFVQHDAYAMRLVARMAAEVDSTVSKFPEDFHLYRVGEFDDVCGMLTHVEFEPVCSVAAVLGGSQARLGQLKQQRERLRALPSQKVQRKGERK